MLEKSEKQRLRVAMVCDFVYPRLGGVENHIWSLSSQLSRRGHKVIIITHSYGNRKGVRYMSCGAKVYYCPIRAMTDQDAMPTFTATLPIIRSIVVRESIDVLHAHQATSTLANESIVYATALGVSAVVYTDHSLFALDDVAGTLLNRVMQTTLCTVDAAICVSHTCSDNLILRARLNSASKDQVRVIPNAVDPTQFTPDPERRDKERIKIVVVSRLVYRKGVDLLVGIIPRVCQRLDHVDFVIGGDGSMMLALQEMVERERLQERVEFLGAVGSAAGVRDVLVRGHVFLNCSLTESFCIAILEAASCGLLVVSTRVGGIPEVLPDEMIILSPPNIVDMSEAVCQAVERQENEKTAVDPHIAHERVRNMYSWERVAQETELVYNEILQRRQRPLSFRNRLTRYYGALGGLSGLVAVLVAIMIELWLRIVQLWVPEEAIDTITSGF